MILYRKMKLVQQLQQVQSELSEGAGTLHESSGYVQFIPSRYSGITAIYFEAVGHMNTGANTGKVELYDITHDNVIATLTINTTSDSIYTSSDIKSSLTEDSLLVVRYYRTSGGSSDTLYVHNAKIVVLQDISDVRKTATYYPMQHAEEFTSSTTYQTPPEYKKAKIYTSGNNGSVKIYLEAVLSAMSGGVAYVRLYDKTASQVVSGSEVSVSSTSPTYVKSGELSLTDGHYYCVQHKSGVSGKYMYSNECHVVIVNEGFTETQCMASTFGYDPGVSGTTWRTENFDKYYGSNIDADELNYKWLYNDSLEDWGSGVTVRQRLTRQDNGEVITNSLVETSYIASTYWLYLEATPTLPTEDVQINQQVEYQYDLGQYYGRILAFLKEALPENPFFVPDPSMPSGYHAFMSNFLKNVTANYKPLATPDGTNRLY